MSALQHINDLLEALKAPEVFTKSPQRRNAANKALESLNMLAKGETAWGVLTASRVQLYKVFDPDISPEDTIIARTRLLQLIPEITKHMPAKATAPSQKPEAAVAV